VSIEDFFWNDFCDNYLEIVKVRAYGDIPDKTLTQPSPKGEDCDDNSSAQSTISICLQTILKLFAPFIPHVTEKIYQLMFDSNSSIHSQGSWPKYNEFIYDEDAIQKTEQMKIQIDQIRKAKSEAGVSIKKPISKLVLTESIPDDLIQDFRNVCNVECDIETGERFVIEFSSLY
jgi:valyl-tRNA synthetase